MTELEDEPEFVITEEERKKSNDSMLSLITVGLVLAVLGAIMVPNHLRARARGQFTLCKSNLKNIGTALQMYSEDNSGKYPPALGQLTPNYLKTLPECRGAGEVSYRLTVGQTTNDTIGYEENFYLECHGENHENVNVTGHYPAYDSRTGFIERP